MLTTSVSIKAMKKYKGSVSTTEKTDWSSISVKTTNERWGKTTYRDEA